MSQPAAVPFFIPYKTMHVILLFHQALLWHSSLFPSLQLLLCLTSAWLPHCHEMIVPKGFSFVFDFVFFLNICQHYSQNPCYVSCSTQETLLYFFHVKKKQVYNNLIYILSQHYYCAELQLYMDALNIGVISGCRNIKQKVQIFSLSQFWSPGQADCPL